MRATDIGEINWVLLIVSWRLKLRLLTLIHFLDIFVTGVCETLAGFCQNSTGVPLIATKTWDGICIFLWNSPKSNTFIYPIWNHIWNKKCLTEKVTPIFNPGSQPTHTAGDSRDIPLKKIQNPWTTLIKTILLGLGYPGWTSFVVWNLLNQHLMSVCFMNSGFSFSAYLSASQVQ